MYNELSISLAKAYTPGECVLRFEHLGIRSGLDRVHLGVHLPEIQGLPRKFEHHTNKMNRLFLSTFRLEHIFSVRLDLLQVIRMDTLK